MQTKKGWNQSLMMGLKTKETSYNAATTVNSSNFMGVKGHSDYDPDWGDEVQNDKDTVSGTEHGTDVDIITQGFKCSIAQPRAKPYFLLGMLGGAMGSVTATQDGALAAYRQRIIPVTVGTALPSFNVIGVKGGLQYLHKGNMVNSVALSMEEGKPVSVTADIIGSGSRDTNADSFIAEPTQNWMLMSNGYCWMEQDANISIAASPTQGAENISSSTPDDLKIRIKKADFKWNNNLEGQFGFGNGNSGVYQDMDYGRRGAELSVTLRHSDATDLGWYTANTILAFEAQVKGALIANGGTMYYGFVLRIPRLKLTKPPLPKGGVGDSLTLDLACDVEDDGTNSVVIFDGYSETAAFFA